MESAIILSAFILVFYMIVYLFLENIEDRNRSNEHIERMQAENEGLLETSLPITMHDTNIVTIPLPPKGYDIQGEYSRFMNGGPINGTVTESIYANPDDKLLFKNEEEPNGLGWIL